MTSDNSANHSGKPGQQKDTSAARAQYEQRIREAVDRSVEKSGGDINQAERTAARDINVTKHVPMLGIGVLLVVLAVFFPHSGDVYGYDVLLDSPKSQVFQTNMPERVYMILAVSGGIFLTIGTIVSRSWIVAWVTWAVVGIGWWYSVFAIWMAQTRPATHPGQGPAFGLIIGAIGMTILFLTLIGVLFARTPLQMALALARRQEADRSEESRLEQQRLRTGIEPREDAVIVDDRRARARARRAHRTDRED